MRLALLLALANFAGFESSSPAIRGLWLKETSDPREFRFYYFHTEGVGLYRYGRRHLNNTHSFDYRLEDRSLVLAYRKTGEQHRVPYRVERRDDKIYLLLEDDPREKRPTRYRRIEGPLEMTSPTDNDHPFARMWTELRRYATGGMGFRIYQFQAPDEGGRGRGWYHQGDYDEWSTEAFSYERIETRVHLHFLERNEDETTEFRETAGTTRTLEFRADPRNFWLESHFKDGGRSIIGLGGADLVPR